VQLYVRDDVASLARADRQLVGFVRVPLGPGTTRTVTLRVEPSRLAFFDDGMRVVSEPGPHLIEAPVPNAYSARQLQAMPFALRVIERLPRPLASALTRRLAS